MSKYILKDGDQVYCTGVYLIYDNGEWIVDSNGINDDIYFDGLILEYDNEIKKYYVEYDEEDE